ncbi:MAG TPA: hypothetical protein PKX66_08745 [Rectinema sp.]|nr:hypothetical protein [Rectinema sp.]
MCEKNIIAVALAACICISALLSTAGACSADTVKFGLGASVETYWHSNTTDFVDESDWVVGFEDGTCSRTS